MIKKLSLRNWRSYRDASLDFGAGTTFIVASNGVGKTSLIEAVRFALFDVIERDSGSPVRAGFSSASVIVELELPDSRTLTVERSITAKNRRSARPASARLDGEQLPSDALASLLAEVYKADRLVLARLTMPAVDRDDDKPTALKLEDHLGRYFGVDNLKMAIAMLADHQRATAARIRQIKAAKAGNAEQIGQLQRNADEAAHRVEQAVRECDVLRSRLANARKCEQFEVELQSWQARSTLAAQTAEKLLVQVLPDLGQSVAAEDLESLLEERRTNVDRGIEEVRIALAVGKTKEDALAANDERLGTAHDDCPVCRRPLDETTVEAAHSSNARDIVALRAEAAQLRERERELSGRRERLNAALGEWRHVPRPAEPPRRPELAEEPLAAADLDSMMRAAESSLIDARSDHKIAVRALEEAQSAAEGERQLLALFGREAKLKVATDATAATLAELIEQTIRPLASELDERWNGLFQDRGRLSTASNGQIARDIEGTQLPYESFSTGERMGAIILLRLLVVQMVTSVDFCWFDEPLEHLDPQVRRKMADLLSSATGEGNPLRQVVVTTYEEPLVRQLHMRDTERVRIIDVRESSS